MKPQERQSEIQNLRIISGDATGAKAEHRDESLRAHQQLPLDGDDLDEDYLRKWLPPHEASLVQDAATVDEAELVARLQALT